MSSNPWKFKDLKFPKPDLRSFQDLNADAIERIKNAADGDTVLEVIFEHSELARRANDLLEVSLIRYSMDTTNEKYNEERRWVYEHKPLFERATVEFNEAVYNSPFKDYIEKKLGPMYFTKMDVAKQTFCEDNILLLQRESELEDEYQALMATCQVEIDGEPRSFLALQRLFGHDDREIRKAAFKAFSNFLNDNKEKLEAIWDELIKTRTKMGKTLGYDNYLPVAYLRRGRLEYSPEDVANFRKQVVEEIVPICNKLFEAQKKRLGLDKLMAYDESIAFPDGNAEPLYDEKGMLDEVFNVVSDMSPETEEFVDYMLDHELMDLDRRPGKAAREYSTMIASRKAPFLFSHFDGSAKSVKILLGEIGHAFATYRSSRKQPVDSYYASTSDIMEIHVMSMTQFSNRYAERLFGKDADKYRFFNLQDLMTFLPFGVAVDEFQHICYENPDLTPEERNLEWKKLEEKYMPWRTYEEDDDFMNSGGYWNHKQHIYLYPLYYIEYPLATINAMEMHRKYAEHPEIAWQDYLRLVDMGGSKRYLETLTESGLTPLFQDGAVAKAISYVKDELEKFIENE